MLEAAHTPNVATSRGEAAQAQFSIKDYGYVGDQAPYQIIRPTYPAPQWLGRYENLDQALRECRTLCRLQGRPFRLVQWGKPVRSGCQDCGFKPTNRLPNVAVQGRALGIQPGLDGIPRIARPLADVYPDGAVRVWNKDGKGARMVGEQNYTVTTGHAPRGYHPPNVQGYYDAVKSAQYLASRTGRRAYICTTAKCKGTKKLVPVSYVQPGGLRLKNPPERGSDVVVTPVTPQMFREALMESRGGTFYGEGA